MKSLVEKHGFYGAIIVNVTIKIIILGAKLLYKHICPSETHKPTHLQTCFGLLYINQNKRYRTFFM